MDLMKEIAHAINPDVSSKVKKSAKKKEAEKLLKELEMLEKLLDKRLAQRNSAPSYEDKVVNAGQKVVTDCMNAINLSENEQVIKILTRLANDTEGYIEQLKNIIKGDNKWQ